VIEEWSRSQRRPGANWILTRVTNFGGRSTRRGNISVEVVRQRYSAFEDDDLKIPMGGNSVETHDLAGHEEDPPVAEDA
jgi:hypothetical protein